MAHRCNDGFPSRCGCRLPCRWRAPVLFEAGPAEHRPSLRRTERNGRLLPAYRAVRPGLCPHAGAAAPLQLARLTALRIVVKLFVVKKQLLAGGEDEVLPAVHAFEYFVLEFHDPVACRHSAWLAAPALLEKRTELARARPPKRPTATASTLGEEKLERNNMGNTRSRAGDTEGPRFLYESAGPGDCLLPSPALCAPFSGYVSAPVLP